MKATVSLNENAYVRLTPAGRQRFEASISGVPEPHRSRMLTRRDDKGRLKMQLHELMYTFGSMCVVGGEIPFQDNEIEFEPESRAVKMW